MRAIRNDARFVLAFDGGCQLCRRISQSVEKISDGRLDVMPLGHEDVKRWRLELLGADTPWAPALFEVRGGEGVKAWTGRAMAIPLLRCLGIRATAHVLRLLGELTESEQRSGGHVGGQVMGRKNFIRLGAGAAVAAGLLATGQLPAFADEQVKAKKWVEVNREKLPFRYDDVIDYSLEYRKAIFAELPIEARASLWIEQINRYVSSHGQLTFGQAQVIEDSLRLLREDARILYSLKTAEKNSVDRVEAVKIGIRERAIAEFGFDEARSLIATLGPVPIELGSTSLDTIQADCACNNPDSWCGWGWACWKYPDVPWCTKTSGCGEFYCCECNGQCVDV